MSLADDLNEGLAEIDVLEDLAVEGMDLAEFLREMLDKDVITDPWWRNQTQHRIDGLRDLL